jgi:hypothetical protein
MIYAYWAVVAAIVIMNIAGTIAVSWWLVAALVALPLIVLAAIFVVSFVVIYVAERSMR